MNASEFVDRWYCRAADSNDCFDRFFAAWIALVIEARRHLTEQLMKDPDRDRVAVVHYFEERADAILAVLSGLPDSTRWLSQRTGRATGAPILDVPEYSRPYLRDMFDLLAQVWSGKTERKPRCVAAATAEMINHIRNNMFHGLKAPDDAADRELLEHVNPILMGLLESRSD